MSEGLEKAAEQFMETEEGRAVAGKRAELDRLAGSGDGAEVKRLLEDGGFESAVTSGDTERVKSVLKDALSTDAGARLMRQLAEMMGK